MVLKMVSNLSKQTKMNITDFGVVCWLTQKKDGVNT